MRDQVTIHLKPSNQWVTLTRKEVEDALKLLNTPERFPSGTRVKMKSSFPDTQTYIALLSDRGYQLAGNWVIKDDQQHVVNATTGVVFVAALSNMRSLTKDEL